MILIVGCNDNNGSFKGNFESIVLKQGKIEADLFAMNGPCKIEFDHKRHMLTIGKAKVSYTATRTWPGSWCCDQLIISRKNGIKILKHLIDLKFDVEEITEAEDLEDMVKLLERM